MYTWWMNWNCIWVMTSFPRDAKEKKTVSFNLQFICKGKGTWNYSSPTFILHFLEVFCIQILSHTLFCHASKSMQHFGKFLEIYSKHLILLMRGVLPKIWDGGRTLWPSESPKIWYRGRTLRSIESIDHTAKCTMRLSSNFPTQCRILFKAWQNKVCKSICVQNTSKKCKMNVRLL